MASESAMWDSLRPRMRTLDPVRIEDMFGLGVPDVNFTRGWMELKYLPEWPARETTEVKCDHFTPEQRAWLIKRSQAGGRTYLMLKVGESEWLLFSGMDAARYLGNTTRKELLKATLAYWNKLPPAQELLKWLLR